MSAEMGLVAVLTLVVYPFVVLGLARRIATHNRQSVFFLIGLLVAGAAGGIAAAVFLRLNPGSKWPGLERLAGFVFAFGVSATGGLIGALLDRRRGTLP